MAKEIVRWVEKRAVYTGALFLNIGQLDTSYQEGHYFILNGELPLSTEEANILKMCYPEMVKCIDTLVLISKIDWCLNELDFDQEGYYYKAVSVVGEEIRIDGEWR